MGCLVFFFSTASVSLINSCLSSVTNVSLPSSSPGEEEGGGGGVFNVQFLLWIDVCGCVIHAVSHARLLFLLFLPGRVAIDSVASEAKEEETGQKKAKQAAIDLSV